MMIAALAAGMGFAGAAQAATLSISGTRFNITPGGAFGGRCAPAITVSFAPGAHVAGGTSNLGAFTYVASHCIAGPPPGDYFDGEFTWTLPGGTLSGTHFGALGATALPGEFTILEWLTFTGGTGKFAGASGSATYEGLLQFGFFFGAPGSTADGSFTGRLTAPGIPEPATWATLIAGFGMVGFMARRRHAAATA
ncbi:PEPxxWA-CTERM sorting domain-containing protein [Thermaurantiacus sp.]